MTMTIESEFIRQLEHCHRAENTDALAQYGDDVYALAAWVMKHGTCWSCRHFAEYLIEETGGASCES